MADLFDTSQDDPEEAIVAETDSLEAALNIEADVTDAVAAIASQPGISEVHRFASGSSLLVRISPGRPNSYLIQDTDGATRSAVFRARLGDCFACEGEDRFGNVGGGIGGNGPGGPGHCVKVPCPDDPDNSAIRTAF